MASPTFIEPIILPDTLKGCAEEQHKIRELIRDYCDRYNQLRKEDRNDPQIGGVLRNGIMMESNKLKTYEKLVDITYRPGGNYNLSIEEHRSYLALVLSPFREMVDRLIVYFKKGKYK